MPVPQKILTRKDEITADFFKILDRHMANILSGKVSRSYEIRDFAEELHIHPTHFSNTIKLTTGKSPCHFFEDKLMDEAKRMLGDSAMPINEVASRLTFNDATNFTKFFKRFAGQTPREFRKSLQESETATIF
jgi:AraC-like DNA-binding protein